MADAAGIAEGRKEICGLARASWRTILRKKTRSPAFKALIHTNPVSGKPYIVLAEWEEFLSSRKGG